MGIFLHWNLATGWAYDGFLSQSLLRRELRFMQGKPLVPLRAFEALHVVTVSWCIGLAMPRDSHRHLTIAQWSPFMSSLSMTICRWLVVPALVLLRSMILFTSHACGSASHASSRAHLDGTLWKIQRSKAEGAQTSCLQSSRTLRHHVFLPSPYAKFWRPSGH